jgi:hypothetical protein
MTTDTTPQLSPVKQIESLYARLEKARSIYTAGKVHKVLGIDEHYVVESSKGDGFYLVNGICTCMDAQHRIEIHHGWCCHKLAVELFKEQQAEALSEEKGLGESPKVPKAVTAPPESDRSLEDQLSDLYPKARPSNSPR